MYQDAFFVAFPTYDEGFGLPMIEAFERKVPVIASDCPVMKEVGESWLFILKQNLRIHLKLFLKNI